MRKNGILVSSRELKTLSDCVSKMIDLASNENSINGKTHNLAMQLIYDSTDSSVADSIKKVETSELYLDDLNTKKEVIMTIAKKEASFAKVIANFVTNKTVRKSKDFLYELKCMDIVKNIDEIKTWYNVLISESVQKSKHLYFIINSIHYINPDYLGLLEKICLDETCLCSSDFDKKVNIIINSISLEEAKKNISIILNNSNDYDDLDVILYNAMMYVDENNNEKDLDIPPEVLRMTKPNQIM